jgi:hypothetical protein
LTVIAMRGLRAPLRGDRQPPYARCRQRDDPLGDSFWNIRSAKPTTAASRRQPAQQQRGPTL